jgi:hypothetical protein
MCGFAISGLLHIDSKSTVILQSKAFAYFDNVANVGKDQALPYWAR